MSLKVGHDCRSPVRQPGHVKDWSPQFGGRNIPCKSIRRAAGVMGLT